MAACDSSVFLRMGLFSKLHVGYTSVPPHRSENVFILLINYKFLPELTVYWDRFYISIIYTISNIDFDCHIDWV